MTNQQITSYSIRLKVPDRKSLDAELDRAVDDAILSALEQRGNGILVTRLGHDSFTVELSPQVPYGIVLERDLRGTLQDGTGSQENNEDFSSPK